MTYSDPVRKNSVDLHFKGVAPPIMFADGNHFEQTMKVTGELVLRGKRYDVDCYNVRDRSWGKPRQETIQPLPPMSWVTGTFNDNFSFNCNMLDCVEGNPELKGTPFALTADKALNAGWLYRDGKVGNIVRATKRVGRAPGTFLPITLDFEATDDLDRTFRVQGKLVSSLMQTAWQNIDIHINLMRWECEGMVAYGDCQEGSWTDYFHYMNGR
jgi:hypothetical protein